jgi:lipopolysaccharide exporter
MLIGRMLNPTQLGIYSIGAEVAFLPTTELVEPLCRAAFSGFAAVRNADLTPGETYLRIVGTMALLTLPAAVGISMIAEPLVKLAFGALWADAAPLAQILALSGVVTLFGLISGTLFGTYALLRQTFAITVGMLLLRVGLLIFFIARRGLYGAAIATATAIAVQQVVYVILTLHYFSVRAGDLLRATWRPVLATTAMAIVLLQTGHGWRVVANDPGVLARELLIAVSLGALVYTVVLLAAWFAAGRPEGAETDLVALMRRLVGRFAGQWWAR